MRSRTSTVLVVAVLATGIVGLAGCGSDSSSGDPTPTSTPDLTIPGGADQLPGGASGTTSNPTTAPAAPPAPPTPPRPEGPRPAPAPPAAPPPPAASGGGTTTSAAPAPAPAQ